MRAFLRGVDSGLQVGCDPDKMKILRQAPLIRILALAMAMLAGAVVLTRQANSQSTEETLRKIEEVPAQQREVVLLNAAGFSEQTWKEFLATITEYYLVDARGQLIALKQPATEKVPSRVDTSRFQQFISWKMEPAQVGYTYISSQVSANTGGMLMLESGGMVRLTPETATKYAPGDTFQSWCKASASMRVADEEGDLDFGLGNLMRTYTPVDLRKPELIEVSNYLVKGGKIFGLAPRKEKSCPVCIGMRKYSPNKEVPTETVACDGCQATGKVWIRPLFMVYTGTP